MRSRLTRWVTVVAIATSGFVVSPDSAAGQAQVPRDRPERGLVYKGLERRPDGVCRRLYEVRHLGALRGCTHGPDPAPPGVEVQAAAGPEPLGSAGDGAAAASTAASARCDGDGVSGYRVQVIYAVALDRPDRYNTYAESIRQWALAADGVVNASARETGGTRRVRFVHDSACQPVVTKVRLTPAGDDNFTLTTNELAAQSFNRPDRKYLVWVDATVYCGIAGLWDDDRPGQENANNGNPPEPPDVGRIDFPCWGLPDSVEAHELGHLLGAVQMSAPHATSASHCWDETDRMCYTDESGTAMQQRCPAHENRFDCNHDDYFHTSPTAGSYLASHWNAASSRFLISAGTALSLAPDFDGNGATDLSVYRPSTGEWLRPSSPAIAWGIGGDVPVPGDYEGDGRHDVAVYRPAEGTWYIQRSSGGVVTTAWGTRTDVPVPGDYDGDGRHDVAVYRPAEGTWYIQRSSGGVVTTAWGTRTDVPVPGDYDGDGITDIAVYRPATGLWAIRTSSAIPDTFVTYGIATDVPVPADYDGDARTDLAVFRPEYATWWVRHSSTGADVPATFGIATDVPVPGDYDGNGRHDIAVYRPSEGTWYLQRSTGGYTATAWGISTDVALPLPPAVRLRYFP